MFTRSIDLEMRRLAADAVAHAGRDQSGNDSNGSCAGMSGSVKWSRFRVRTVRSWTPVVTAMVRSA